MNKLKNPPGVDILIPLNNGSKHNDIELKYCLRSLQKHMTGTRNLWIVGEKPAFLDYNYVHHVPYHESTDNTQRARNIFDKICKAINYISPVEFHQTDEDFINDEITASWINLSDMFLFVNDDHFLLKDYEAKTFPSYHRGILDIANIPNEAQTHQMANTLQAIIKKRGTGAPIYDFDVHCPILYNKRVFQNTFTGVDWPPFGHGIKSLYANVNMISHTNCKDVKIMEPAARGEIMHQLDGKPWFSISDRALSGGDLIAVLEELYPEKSVYEL